MTLTLHIILSVRLVALIVMHHLHHLQQILLAQLRQSLSQLLHIDIPVLTLPRPLLLRTRSRRSHTSTIAPSFITYRPTLPQRLQQLTLRIPKSNLVHTLIPLATLEVQIMRQDLLATLRAANGRERDLHVEFSPALLTDGERRLAEGLALALGAEAIVEDVGDFLEAVGGHLVAIGGLKVDVDGPGAHGDVFDFWRVRGDVLLGDKLDGAFDLGEQG